MKKVCKLLLWALLLLYETDAFSQQDNTMYAHYINVGQASAVLLEFPCGAVLIDAGAQDDEYQKYLLDYLTRFFQKRKDLNNTISLLMVTHPHLDHNEALDEIAQKFRVNKYIDDGLRLGSGKTNQKWMQDNAAQAAITYKTYSFEAITKGGNKKGKTDSIIDPVNCANGDPKIILYSGQLEEQPDDWSDTDYKNYNNHSLVVKVVFGKSSFLFTGDLEKKGIQHILDEYEGTDALDVDVLMVGHHGAANAITDDYLEAVSPTYAIISCGEWDFGKGETNKFTTFAYGHPRISTLNLLDDGIPGKRSEVQHVKAADGAKDFRFINVRKRIYATPWDKTIVVRANTLGKYMVYTDNN